MQNASLSSLIRDPERLAALDDYRILDTVPEVGFDDVVRLATRLCAVPVALVSLVAADRQWFKARIGFPPCETDLDRSVCKFALPEPDLLVIPDLTLDPRTIANPLVTGEPGIRFYAGAPLRMTDGTVLGSLCVIDTVPRPDGLTSEQADDLRALGRQVSSLLELRRTAASERRAQEAALADARRLEQAIADQQASEAHWRGLFERLSEGFIVGEVLRNAAGAITDWRYVDVNAAWGRLVSIDPATVVGRTIRDVFPGIEDAWVDEFADVVETGEPVTFVRQVGALARWYEGRAFSLSSERFAVIFLEVTERVQADARRNGLLEFGDRLRDDIDATAIAMAGSTILGRVLGVGRVGYGTVGPDGESFVVEEDWTAANFPTLAGRYRMDDYGLYAEDLRRGREVVIADVREDPRTTVSAGTLEAVTARTLVNVPIVERGRTVAVLYVNDDRPRSWTTPEVAVIRQIAELTRQAVERKRAEEQQDLLNHELSHRLKNTLAMVVSIAHQTLRSVPGREPVEAFQKRIQALASAHDLLLRRNWTAADLRAVCREVLSTAAETKRFTLDGPDVALGPSAALSASLLLHELATNAAKYGCLSGPEGEVELRWWIELGSAEPGLVLRWREHGGPPVVAPSRRGFGSRLIRTGLVGTGDVDLEYHTDGLVATMRAPLVEVQRS